MARQKKTTAPITRSEESSRAANNRYGSFERCISDCSIRKADEGERRFTLSFSSEEPYRRWFGTEILSHKEGDVDLTRLNTIGVVLFNHDRDRVIGKILNARLDNGRAYADIEFDKDADSEALYQKVASGTLRGVSVGYRVDEWDDVKKGKKSEDGRFDGPCSVATKWMPYEISIVSVPADPTVGVGRSDDNNRGVSGFYYYEKQLQINKNLLRR